MNIQPMTSGVTAPATMPERDVVALRQSQNRAASSSGIEVDPLKAPEAVNKSAEAGEIEKAVKDVQDFVTGMNQNIQFSIDKESGKTIIKVIDRQTEQILRQIPSEEMLQIAKALGKLDGLLVKQTA